MKQTLISDVVRSSFHDGPGIRTVVYFKGCPLKCAWCHNPECISFDKQILVYKDKCIGCGKCDKGCYSGAKVTCGRYISPEELAEIIRADKTYFGENGGVTFSGGEPLAHSDYIAKVLDILQDDGINFAVETSLVYFKPEILSRMQTVMADLKIWDSELHKKYTGSYNDEIKSNFIKLDKLGVSITARTPLVPEIDQEIDKISDFLKKLKNVKKYELLKYHPLGKAKYDALEYKFEHFSVPTEEYFKEMQKYAFDIC